ncbi:hypothetical protein Tco_1015862, partial [Tanacetum coccineum]
VVINDLTLVKPHIITAASFQKTLASEVGLTSHMLKVAKLFEEPEHSLIPSSEKVNADDNVDKSLYRASEVILPKKQVAETQHTKVTVATADATKSLEASELAEEQVIQPSAAGTKKFMHEPERIIEMGEEAEEQSLEIPTVEQLLDESFFTRRISDIQDEIMHDSEASAGIQEDSNYESMPDNDLRSVSEFRTADSDEQHGNEESLFDHIFHNDNTFAERLSLPDHMDHICEEVSSLHSKLGDMESSIIQQVLVEIKSSLPALVTIALNEQLHGFLSATLKEFLPSIIEESLQTHIPTISEQFAAKQSKLNKKVVKHLNR